MCNREPSTPVDVRAAASRLSSNRVVPNGVPYLPVIGLVTLPPDVLTVTDASLTFLVILLQDKSTLIKYLAG